MYRIYRAVQRAQEEYDDVADRFERGQATRRELTQARNKLAELQYAAESVREYGGNINDYYQPVTAGV